MVPSLDVLHIGANLIEDSGLPVSSSEQIYKDVPTKAPCVLLIGGVGLGLGPSLPRALRLPMGGSGKTRAQAFSDSENF